MAKMGVLLAPGAGADSSSPALRAVEAELPKRYAVRRFDFPYRKAGRRAPDRPPVLLQSVRDEAADFAKSQKIKPENIYLGGRSMGGRICSMAVAEGLAAAGLILLSYPLHPPGKPGTLRVEHFAKIEVPCLFISGTRDAFGAEDELMEHAEAIPGGATLYFVEGGDHAMNKHNKEVAELVAEWLSERDD